MFFVRSAISQSFYFLSFVILVLVLLLSLGLVDEHLQLLGPRVPRCSFAEDERGQWPPNSRGAKHRRRGARLPSTPAILGSVLAAADASTAPSSGGLWRT